MDTTPTRIVVFWRMYDGYRNHLCQQEFVRGSSVSVATALRFALNITQQYEDFAGALGFLVNPTPEVVDETCEALAKSLL